MVLSKEAIEEFKELYKKRFKEELTDEEAYRKAIKLLDLFEVVYGSKYKKHEKIKNK
jgi:hypothetical protein